MKPVIFNQTLPVVLHSKMNQVTKLFQSTEFEDLPARLFLGLSRLSMLKSPAFSVISYSCLNPSAHGRRHSVGSSKLECR